MEISYQCANCGVSNIEIGELCTNCGQPLDTADTLPWGPWKSLGMTFLILIAQIVVSIACTILYIAYSEIVKPDFNTFRFLAKLESNHLFALTTMAISAPIIMGMVFLFAKLSKYPVNAYLGLIKPAAKQIGLWLAATLLFLASSGFILELLGVKDPEFMQSINKDNTYVFILLALLTMSVIPLYEEFVFRGFLYTGLRYSKAGVAGAIIIPSFLWSVIHMQYEPMIILSIFFQGIVFGIARYKTGSIWVPVAMHSFSNALASLALYFK